MEPGDGRAFAMMVAFKHLLRKLESNGTMSREETILLLDGMLEDVRKGTGNFAPEQAAAALSAVADLWPLKI